MALEDYSVARIGSKLGRDFIIEHHYTHGCHNGPMCWGMFNPSGELIGVCAFATPSSEAVRASVFGPDFKSSVTELHRLVILDNTPKNAESWFVSRALSGLVDYKPQYGGGAVLSFADPAEGHVGTIYQALNALFCGSGGGATFYRDPATGKLHHPRNNGVNMTRARARELGLVAERRPGKYRYLFLTGSKSQRKAARKRLILETFPYPIHP